MQRDYGRNGRNGRQAFDDDPPRGALPPEPNYSPVEHLARIVWCGEDWKKVLLIMVSATPFQLVSRFIKRYAN